MADLALPVENLVGGGCRPCRWRLAMPEGAQWPKCPSCGEQAMPWNGFSQQRVGYLAFRTWDHLAAKIAAWLNAVEFAGTDYLGNERAPGQPRTGIAPNEWGDIHERQEFIAPCKHCGSDCIVDVRLRELIFDGQYGGTTPPWYDEGEVPPVYCDECKRTAYGSKNNPGPSDDFMGRAIDQMSRTAVPG